MTRLSAVSRRIVAWWERISVRCNPIAVIVVGWGVLTLPLVVFRGYNSDEGLAVIIARTALESGDWITPHLFNIRIVERPTLLSWIIAAFSAPFGHVSQITARLPVALFLLGGCFTIHTLLRKMASPAAAMFRVALFLASLLVFRSYVMITADMPLAVLLFIAFVMWWNGYAAGATSLGRWIAIGAVLALAGLMKGPQPIAFFALGVALFVLGARAWRQIPGLVLAGTICVLPLIAWYWYVFAPGDEAIWAAFMRLRPMAMLPGPRHTALSLVANTLPASFLATAYLACGGFRGHGRVPAALVWALVSYATIATLIILFWPGGSAGRYFLPMVLPLCVLGAFAYDALGQRQPLIVSLGVVTALGLLTHALLYSVVASPLLPNQFRSTKLDAARIVEMVGAAPDPVYRINITAFNIFAYVPGRITVAEFGTFPDEATDPQWIAALAVHADALLKMRPGELRVVGSFGRSGEWRLLRFDGRRQQNH